MSDTPHDPVVSVPVSQTNATVSPVLQGVFTLVFGAGMAAAGYVVGHEQDVMALLKSAPGWLSVLVTAGIKGLEMWYLAQSNAATKQALAAKG